MKFNHPNLIVTLLGVVAFYAPNTIAQQSAYPNKTVKVLVPYAAGGGTDQYARMVSQELATIWKQPVVVENKPGAAGVIALQSMLGAPADGYTITTIAASLAVSSLINPNLPYKDGDIIPVVNLVSSPNVMFVGANSPYRTAKELIEDARRNPGKISYGTTGNGTVQHIIGEKLAMQEKIDIQAVPYKGVVPVINDVMAGQIPMGFGTLAEVHNFAKGDKLRILAVLDKTRSPMFPDVPTMEEAGYSNLESKLWWGFVVSKGTPPNVIAAINKNVNTVLSNPAIRKRVEDSGAVIEGGTSQAFENQMAAYRKKYAPVIKAAGISNN